MSISSNLERINGAKSTLKTFLTDNNVTVPDGTKIDAMAELLDEVKSGVLTESYTFNQQRAEVIKYLTEVTYDPANYTVSQIPNYVTATSSNRPVGVAITIKEAGTLTIVDGYTGNSISKQVNAGTITVYNCTPGSISKFVVLNTNNAIVQHGLIKPTGTCRMIYMTNVDNVRDLGGWTCDGGTVKYGKLFRGGEVYGFLTEDGAAQALDVLGIEKEIDLRFDSDLNGRTESGFGNSVDMFHVDFTWNDLNYQKSSGNIKKLFDPLFDYVIAGHPTYFHCSAGADRTGVVALLCEAVLGMSQSDMDKEYELTCFYSGVENDNQARRRNEAIWTREINIINSYSGTTFRDKAVNYMVSCGITIEKINAFRAAMINGTPDILTADINTYTVTKTLTNITTDNNATSAKQYQSYIAQILPDDGKIIENIKVTMGGIDITGAVFDGNETILRRSITKNLTQCTSSNTRIYAISGQSYVTSLIANEGYNINSVSITMGGVDVSTFYKDGIISIPEVTGDIVITATAITQAPSYTNQIPISTDSAGAIYNNIGYKDGYRISDSGVDEEYGHKSVTGFIPIKKGDTIRIKGIYNNDVNSCRICTYDNSKTFKAARNGAIFATTGSYSLLNDIMTYAPNEYFVDDATRYFRFSCDTGAHTGEEDGSKLIITINEPIE